MIRKSILILIIALFAAFAFFQWNDPDGLRWIIYYLLISGMGLLSFLKKNKRYYLLMMGGFTIAMLIYFSPSAISWFRDGMPNITSSMKAESPYIELVREFLGLMISLAAIIYMYLDLKTYPETEKGELV